MKDAISLRQQGISEESLQRSRRQARVSKLVVSSKLQIQIFKLLEKYNYPSNLKKLTGFSLPEGREPANSDQWIFVAFKPDGEGNIEPENVPIFSMKDARKITDLPPTTIGSMREDSLELYDLDLENPKFSELVQQVFSF